MAHPPHYPPYAQPFDPDLTCPKCGGDPDYKWRSGTSMCMNRHDHHPLPDAAHGEHLHAFCARCGVELGYYLTADHPS